MHFLDVLDFLVEEDDGDYRVPLKFTPVKFTSQATLQALEHIEEDFLPLLGFHRPKQRPVKESIRVFWDHAEADVASRPRHDFYEMGEVGVENTTQELNHTTTISERQDYVSTTEYGSTASDVSTSPPPDDNGSTQHSPDTSTVATTEGQDRTQQYSQRLSPGLTTPHDGDRAEGRQALSRALRSVRQRRSEEYREGIHQMLKRGERTRKIWRILSLTEDGGP